MPFMPFTLSDLLSIPTFTPISTTDEDEGGTDTEVAFGVVARSIIYQILSGVAYLHSPERRIAHRDIKPRNVLLDTSGNVVLIDFGVAYSPTPGPEDVWPEPEGKMYFEVGSGPYRAPELLFGTRKYDATACDLWALGATFAEFFTTLHRRVVTSEFDDDEESGDGDPTQAYIFDELPEPWSRTEWDRYSLFDGSRGDIGLAWSIFRTRGSPTPENWPTFAELPDANKINFMDAPGVHLQTLLSHIDLPPPDRPPSHSPPTEQVPTALDFVQRFLVYPPESRLKAADALRHPWLMDEGPLVLPSSVLRAGDAELGASSLRADRTAGQWLKMFFAPDMGGARALGDDG
ncbi:kinase-like domain-containing protein [Gloeopeniophorella convolvens]|nr:kinase-like domain-containing protein [Gloeopeniophorella convolvens]